MENTIKSKVMPLIALMHLYTYTFMGLSLEQRNVIDFGQWRSTNVENLFAQSGISLVMDASFVGAINSFADKVSPRVRLALAL
jgi:hypothetical protein